jgi:hypothetical protein
MHVLSVDIAARKGRMNCGLALIDPSKLVELGEPADDLVWTRTIDATELATISRTLAGVRAELGAPFLLALERQFSARVSPDPTAVEKLMRTRIQFETVAEIRGIACELVYPATWRTILNVLGDGVPMKISKPRKPPKPKGKRGRRRRHRAREAGPQRARLPGRRAPAGRAAVPRDRVDEGPVRRAPAGAPRWLA